MNAPLPDILGRVATAADVEILAAMNQRLIADEGHRNAMTLAQLEERMRGWLAGEYTAVVFDADADAGMGAGRHLHVAYALFRREPEWVYLRQFYVATQHRRKGIGRAAMVWLKANAWAGLARVRLDVLVGNVPSMAFWRDMGFEDYCITMEMTMDLPMEMNLDDRSA